MALEQHTLYTSQLAQFMANAGAQFVGVNEANGHVYRTNDGVTYVAVTTSPGIVTVRRIAGSCAC